MEEAPYIRTVIAEMKDNIIFMEGQLSHLRKTRRAHVPEMEDMIKSIKFKLASEYKKYFCAINCISVESLNDPAAIGRFIETKPVPTYH